MTLLPCQNFGSGKVFEVLVVCDDIDWNWSAFEVMAPGFESFEEGQDFLVMHTVVYFWRHEGSRVKDYGVDLVVGRINGREDGI